MTDSPLRDAGASLALRAGFLLLAVSLPLGITLEALHALKVPVYLHSSMRRELWTLAHAHGNLLGILLLCFASLAERAFERPETRRGIARWLVAGSVAMPIGFFAGGVLNYEGDPSLGILIVPLGAFCLLAALVRAAAGARGVAS
jgi:hypothetical protein